MSITLIIVSVVAISAILVIATNDSFVYAQKENETKYNAKLIGKSVVPPVNTTAAGRAVIFVSEDSLRWKLNVTGITNSTMAHIHIGKKGANGTIVADLLNSGKIKEEPDRTIISGTITSADLQGPLQGKTMRDLESAFNSSNTYIDLHTEKYPNGELRGTIKLQGSSAIATINTNSSVTVAK